MFALDRSACTNLDSALRREWLETNGIGGFACSTVAGANTRRYHGLLTASLHPPVERYLLLSKFEETVFLNGNRYQLSTNLYPGTVHPKGYAHLKSFQIRLFPVWTFEIDGVEIEKRIFLVDGENTVVVEYEVLGDMHCTLELRPLVAFRDYHSLTHRNGALDPTVRETAGGVEFRPYRTLPALHFGHNAAHVAREGSWYFNFDYPRERERGLEAREDLFQPFLLQFEMDGARGATVVASTLEHGAEQAAKLRHREIQRRTALRLPDGPPTGLAPQLVRAADQFVVRRGELHSVIAGYPWFADWGRDTMISLPGLVLATGRFDLAREILLAYAGSTDRGMLPNRFPDSGEAPEYNTVDASLWYFEAVGQFIDCTGDREFVRAQLYETMKSILDWHLHGTRHGIRCCPDGLLAAGVPGVQLTWMDTAATPRHGKAVEIQALWYNALRITEDLAGHFGDHEEAAMLARLAPLTKASFLAKFWNEAAGCLYDVVRPDGTPDPAIRPNQAIALGLGYCMVPDDRARAALEVVERELLTPVGLRTLSPKDAAYHPRHDSDAAYHQGTVWPWLLGPFLNARHRLYPADDASRYLAGFAAHLGDGCIGSIAETFDGDAPHATRGCFAQAWSVAEILRASLISAGSPSDRNQTVAS
jgi:predicted glycogen debranching enzyme